MSNTKPGYDDFRYEVITQDGGNGDVIIPIPPELLTRLGWKPGDQIDIQPSSDGRWIITKVSQ